VYNSLDPIIWQRAKLIFVGNIDVTVCNAALLIVGFGNLGDIASEYIYPISHELVDQVGSNESACSEHDYQILNPKEESPTPGASVVAVASVKKALFDGRQDAVIVPVSECLLKVD